MIDPYLLSLIDEDIIHLSRENNNEVTIHESMIETIVLSWKIKVLDVVPLITPHKSVLTRRNREVVDCTRYCVKNYSQLTNFRKLTRIEGYNGK